MIHITLERPGVAAVGSAQVRNSPDAPIAQNLIACIARQERGVGAEVVDRPHLVDAHVGEPLAALIVEPVVAPLGVARDQLIAPGEIGVDAKQSGALLHPSLDDGRIDPAAERVALAAHLAVQHVELHPLIVIRPGRRQEARVGGDERGAVHELSDREVHVVRLDELSSDRPVRGRRPLRARGRRRPVERAEVRHFDAVVQARHAAAGDDLHVGRSAPFRGEPLHGRGGEVEPRLQPRQADVGRIEITQAVVSLPSAVEGHSALPQREHAALALIRGTGIGAARAGRRIQRPGAVTGGLPLRFRDDAALRHVAVGTAAVGGEHARDGVDLQRARQARRIVRAGGGIARGDVGRHRSPADVLVLVLLRAGEIGSAPRCRRGRRDGGDGRTRRGGLPGCDARPRDRRRPAQAEREPAGGTGRSRHSNS